MPASNGSEEQPKLLSPSSNLNVFAKEFKFTTKVNDQVVQAENNSASSSNPILRKHENTGAIPKKHSQNEKFFKDNRRSWRRESQNQNYAREHNNMEVDSNRDKKFFRNNHYDNRNNRPRYNDNQRGNRYNNNHQRNQNRNVEENISENIQVENPAVEKEIAVNESIAATNNRESNNHQKRKPAVAKKEINLTTVSQRERLTKEIEKNLLECMICCEKIKAFNAIWSCTNCFHILHLNCIKTWMKNSKSDSGEWRCPACNYSSKMNPREYFCFCGKVKNPSVNRNDLPHSCGDMCLSTQNCPHPCQLRCHPGPHEICHASVVKHCGCGKTTKNYQCSMKVIFECESLCEKTLNCTVHKCSKKCHQGECDPCAEEIECSCSCGSEKKKIPCIPENLHVEKYSCEKVCEKILDCGNHQCTQKCHDSKCKPCSLLPQFVRSCPCGKMSIKFNERKSCVDPIATCESKCLKSLKCGPLSSPHQCASRCHLNECPPCNQSTSVKCRCGKMEEKIACKKLINSDLRCKKKCNKFKNCGRHKCNNNCCIDFEHLCLQNCNRNLDCKKHKCQQPCHIGNCSPCHRASFEELHCECGFTIIYPPVPCGTVIKECSKKCTRKHSCDHPVNHNCHSETKCPPCVFLTKKFCHGKHEERKTIPCNQDSFSCGMPCGKMLKCGRHSCIKTCHQGDCEKENDVCIQKCTVKRNECEHNCNTKCHEGECPDSIACREKVQVSCVCGNLKSMKTCEQVEYENRKLQRVRLNMQMQENQNSDGGVADLKDILGNFKKTTKILECNDDCKTLERNRRLDIAFKVQCPTLASTPRFIPNYSEHVRNYYKKDSFFVNMVHEKLTELVKLAKDSKTPFRCHSFPSMNRDKRHVIHDIGELFGVETKAYDAEPNRNIVATATRETCWLPSMSVAEVVQREKGLRRPPSSIY